MEVNDMNILRNKSIFIFATFLIMFWVAFPVCAADSLGRIGFVNTEKAVAGTKEWKKEFAGFKAEFQKEKIKIATREKRIKQIFEEIKKQGFVLDPKLKREKEEKFRSEKKEFERYVQDKNEEFSRREKAIMDRMVKKMVKVIRRIGKEKKLKMILDQKMAIYYSPENDLTDIAIRLFDRMHK